MLRCMSNLLQTMSGPDVVVRYAHMELADPDIARGFADCVNGGATDVIVFPYMLSPAFPHVTFSVTPAFGVHEKLAELILDRAGVEAIATIDGAEADRCWDPDCSEKLCSDACRVKTARQTALPGGSS
jgi:sirohydrochlorin ferrochelatase